LGLARTCYQWNDLETAEKYARQSLQLSKLYDQGIDRYILSEIFLAQLKLAQDDVSGAAGMLAQTEQNACEKGFLQRMPEIAAAQVPVLLRQGNLAEAAQLAGQYELPLSQARVLIAQENAGAAVVIIEGYRQQMEERGWVDERLKALVLQVLALQQCGENEKAAQVLSDALAAAEPGGFIRLFVDEGEPIRELISHAAVKSSHLAYARKLLAAFPPPAGEQPSSTAAPSPLVEPLSQRELEVLRLIAEGLSNQEIGERLFLALDTVKGHNRRIFEKLQVQRRTEAVSRARELGLI
jgi:LuxR family transcriptional regulator, maltose regulon positive regulatory protein